MRTSAPLLAFALSLAASAASAQCGGDFSSFLAGFKAEAVRAGHASATVDRFLAGVRQDPKVIKADRAQGVFTLPFTDFSRRLISDNRMSRGKANEQKFRSTFDRAEQQFGVSRGVLLAFWGLETDYGAVQGDFNTLNALMTLAHDCRRPELFRPQAMAALTLYERGDFDPSRTTGAWAGEIGQVQMLPADILRNGVDGDGNGHVDLKGSSVDALMSGAKMLRSLGWRPNEPWMQEVTVPADLDWRLSGLDQNRPASDWARIGVRPRAGQLPNLPASLLLPMGRNGPAFLTYPNFLVLFEWNKSFVYVTSAAYFATRLEGAPVFNPGNPSPALSQSEMQSLQKKLAARGHDVGKIDGILGAQTRAAVQKEQARLGLPADAWPTKDLASRL